MEGKREEDQQQHQERERDREREREKRELRCGAKMSTWSNFSVAFCRLPSYLCASSFQFNSNTHLSFIFLFICRVFFSSFIFSFFVFALFILFIHLSFWQHSDAASIHCTIFIHNSNLSKNINIHLKRLTLFFVFLCSFVRTAVVGLSPITLPLYSLLFQFNEYGKIVNSTSYFHNQKNRMKKKTNLWKWINTENWLTSRVLSKVS